MGSTNKTTGYSLPQWVGTDKPTFLGDMNDAFLKIDEGMTANKGSASTAVAQAGQAVQDANAALTKANSVETTANQANTNAQNAITIANNAKEDVDSANSNISNLQTQVSGIKNWSTGQIEVVNSNLSMSGGFVNVNNAIKLVGIAASGGGSAAIAKGSTLFSVNGVNLGATSKRIIYGGMSVRKNDGTPVFANIGITPDNKITLESDVTAYISEWSIQVLLVSANW